MLSWGDEEDDDPLFGDAAETSWRTGSLFGFVDLSGVLPLAVHEEEEEAVLLKRGRDDANEDESGPDPSMPPPVSSNKLRLSLSSHPLLLIRSCSFFEGSATSELWMTRSSCQRMDRTFWSRRSCCWPRHVLPLLTDCAS